MTDYTKLVRALRCKSLSKKCDSCKYGYHLCPDSECNDACNVEQVYADAAAAIEELQAEVDALKHDIERYVQMNTDQLSRIGYLQKRLCDWCAVCPKERRKPDDCELIEDPVMYGPSEYTSTDWATVQQPGGDG